MNPHLDSHLWCFGLAAPIYSLGPGPRVGLWVSGCKRSCPGCQSKALQLPQAGWRVSVASATQRVLANDPHLLGLTISGGEPFDQAGPLANLLTQIKRVHPHWNIIAFTGYYYQQLTSQPDCVACLEQIDLLIDGPFIRHLAPVYPLTGSGNQNLLALTTVGQNLRTQIIAQPTIKGETAQDHEFNTFWLGFPDANHET